VCENICKKPSSNIVNINIAVAELRKIQTLDGQKEMVHYGLSTLKKKKETEL
jgi:hypothetical protein